MLTIVQVPVFVYKLVQFIQESLVMLSEVKMYVLMYALHQIYLEIKLVTDSVNRAVLDCTIPKMILKDFAF